MPNLTESVRAFANFKTDDRFDAPESDSVHECGAWALWTVGQPGKPDHETAARKTAESVDHHNERHESFKRCDTDGFLSQWASGIASDEARGAARVAMNGGMDLFPGLYIAATGERVRAKTFSGAYGSCWALCDEAGNFTGEFLSDNRGQRGALAKRGLVVIGEWAPARATITGHGHGLSGSAWATTVRTDGGFPAGAKGIRK